MVLTLLTIPRGLKLVLNTFSRWPFRAGITDHYVHKRKLLSTSGKLETAFWVIPIDVCAVCWYNNPLAHLEPNIEWKGSVKHGKPEFTGSSLHSKLHEAHKVLQDLGFSGLRDTFHVTFSHTAATKARGVVYGIHDTVFIGSRYLGSTKHYIISKIDILEINCSNIALLEKCISQDTEPLQGAYNKI